MHALAALGDFCLLRRMEGDRSRFFNDVGKLRVDAIPLEDIPEMSLNLLGGRFIEPDAKYNAKRPASNDWEYENGFYLLIKYSKYIEVIREFFPLYILLKRVHNLTFPYMRSGDDAIRAFLEELGNKSVSKRDKYRIHARTEIKHKPNKLNYWHMQFHLFNVVDGEEIKHGKIKNYKEPVAIGDQTWRNQVSYIALTDIIIPSIKYAPFGWSIVSKGIYLKKYLLF